MNSNTNIQFKKDEFKEVKKSLPERGDEAIIDLEKLLLHSLDNVSGVFGPEYKEFDNRKTRIRLPSPPFLLIDKALRVDASLGAATGNSLSESHLGPDKWYMKEGVMPIGLLLEASHGGFLILSKMGLDKKADQGEVFRVVSGEVEILGNMPKTGEVLRHEVFVDKVSMTGGMCIVSYHWEASVDSQVRVKCTSQCGLFLPEDLEAGKGVIWSPQMVTSLLDPSQGAKKPKLKCVKGAFSKTEIEACYENNFMECFGESHQSLSGKPSAPSLSGGLMKLLDEIPCIDAEGGPWQRGYVKAKTLVRPEDWYFKAHFPNDPVMPGYLMLDVSLQVLRFYMIYMGFTLDFDNHHFEVETDSSFKYTFRRQVTPQSREIEYEVFIVDVGLTPSPHVRAHILASCDGVKIFHLQDICLRIASNGNSHVD